MSDPTIPPASDPQQPAAPPTAPEPTAAAPEPEQPVETREVGQPTADAGPEQRVATPSDAAAADESALQREVAQLRGLVEQLAARQSTPTAVPQQVVTSQQDDERIKTVRGEYTDWPQRGSDLPQPWDAETLQLPRPGVDRPPLEGGAPDRITPVVVRAGLPMLSSGSQSDEVLDLGRALGALGYPNSVTEATNPYGVYDESLSRAVEAFRRDYNVAEDPTQFVTDQANAVRSHCGPWTIEAVLRAAEREREATAA